MRLQLYLCGSVPQKLLYPLDSESWVLATRLTWGLGTELLSSEEGQGFLTTEPSHICAQF